MKPRLKLIGSLFLVGVYWRTYDELREYLWSVIVSMTLIQLVSDQVFTMCYKLFYPGAYFYFLSFKDHIEIGGAIFILIKIIKFLIFAIMYIIVRVSDTMRKEQAKAQ